MRGELIQLYKIGRELGLANKEIDKIFSYNSFKNRDFGGIMVIIIILFIGFLIVLATFSTTPNLPNVPSNNTYQTGTLYSTVRIKDFNERK